MKSNEAVHKTIREGKSFLVASHINPDGDAIGSSIALGLALEHLGKEAVIYSRDGVPSNLVFLDKDLRVVKTIPDKPFDAAIIVDCASPDRAGKPFMDAKIRGPIIAIDHHRIDGSGVDMALIDESAASTGEAVLSFIKEMNVPVTPEIAMSIYCTLVVDTGFFRFSNTSEKVLRTAADLVAHGADPWLVAKNLEESYSISRFRLLARALDSIEVSEDGRYALMEVTQEMAAKAGAPIEISEEFAGIPRTIAGVIVSALFREVQKDKIRVSLRSKNDIDVSSIAKQFGGGGHAFASGCTVNGNMTEAKKKIGDIIGQVLKS